MEYREMGGSGFKVPVLSLGTGTDYIDLYRASSMPSTNLPEKQGKSVPQVALNWLLQRPSVLKVIVGARYEEQLRQNLGTVDWNLTAAQFARLDAASATPLAYPYWHRRGFAERNPPPV